MSETSEQAVPRLDRKDAELKYACGFYDYPRSGVVELHGERHWFVETEQEYLFRIVRLTTEEWAHEDARKAAFEEHVGDSMSYKDGRRLPRAFKPIEEHAKFYGDPRWQSRRDEYENHPLVAWWDWS